MKRDLAGLCSLVLCLTACGEEAPTPRPSTAEAPVAPVVTSRLSAPEPVEARATHEDAPVPAEATQAPPDEATPAPADEAPRLALDPAAGFAAHRVAVRDAFCAEGTEGFTREDLESCDQIAVSHRAPSGTVVGLEAELVDARVDFEGENAGTYLVLRANGEVRAFALASNYNSGMAGVTADYQVREARYEDVLPGVSAEVVLELYENHDDRDMGGCERSGDTLVRTLICTADGGPPRCAAIVTTQDTYVVLEACDESDGVVPAQAASERHQGYELSLEITDGVAVLRDAGTGRGDAPPGQIGRHPLTAVLAPGSGWQLTPL